MTDKKAILVIGAGDATGGAIAKRFAKEEDRETAKVMLPRHHHLYGRNGQLARTRRSCRIRWRKHVLRALAQGMGRELGPKGIHVVHPVIDAAIAF
jgi:hypothetical protein